MIRVPTAVSSNNIAINKKYNLLQPIGKGGSGIIYNATDLLGNEVAVKHIMKNVNDKTKSYERERKIHPQLDHPNIIKLIEIIENENNIYFVMEKCGMNLYELIESTKPKLLELSTIKKYFKHIVEGVKYLHDKNIAHRDLKLENIVLCDGKVKIIDFGISVYDTEKETAPYGTLDYFAPEIVNIVEEGGYKGKPVDIWALGVILYEMVYGASPFIDKTYRGTYYKITKGTPDYGVINEKKREVINLIKKIFTLNPTKRPTVDDILKDPFLL